MIYSEHIPKNTNYEQQIFYGQAMDFFTVPLTSTWKKPKNAVMVHIFMQCGGTNGGNGIAGAAGAAGGGGGGAPGPFGHCLFMADFLPDSLIVNVKNEDLLALQIPHLAQTSSGGGAHYSTYNGRDFTGIITIGHNRDAGYTNGSNGTTSAGGAGGPINSVTSYVNSRPCFWSTTSFLAWMNATPTSSPTGVAGGFNSVGASDAKIVTISNNGGSLTTCGTGGGGLPTTGNGFNGGALSILDLNNFTTGITIIPGGIGTASDGGNGISGYRPIKNVPYWTGGTGGASGAAGGGNGGNGGNGGYGCGGGGGGGCLTGSIPGVGGKGGDGIIIITSW